VLAPLQCRPPSTESWGWRARSAAAVDSFGNILGMMDNPQDLKILDSFKPG